MQLQKCTKPIIYVIYHTYSCSYLADEKSQNILIEQCTDIWIHSDMLNPDLSNPHTSVNPDLCIYI